MARWAVAIVALAILLVLATAQAKEGFSFTNEDLASEDSMWALYERWVAHHKDVVVRDHGEMTRRFPTFKNNLLRRPSIHPNLGDARNKFRINLFGDRTLEEIRNFTRCDCWD